MTQSLDLGGMENFTRLVFADDAGRVPREKRRSVLGGKGAALAEMGTVLSLPVPPAFTVVTEVCRQYLADGWPEDLDEELGRAVTGLEERTGRRLGDPGTPSW